MMKKDDRSHFDKIYDDTYFDILKYVTTRCSNIDEIQDIMQNIYLNFYIRLKKYGRYHFLNVKKYIYRIARDELSKYYKNKENLKQQTPNEDDKDIIAIIDEKCLTEDIICNNSEKDKIWQIIKQKDITTIKIFSLYFIYEYKICEIAKELEISQSNVKNKLYRTINEIKIKINKEEKQ